MGELQQLGLRDQPMTDTWFPEDDEPSFATAPRVRPYVPKPASLAPDYGKFRRRIRRTFKRPRFGLTDTLGTCDRGPDNPA